MTSSAPPAGEPLVAHDPAAAASAGSGEEPRQPSRIADLVACALVGLLGPLVALRGMVASGLEEVPGGLVDGRLNAFFLEHGWGWVSRQPLHSRLWDLPMFFPGGAGSAAFSDLMLSYGPLYWPWRALGVPADTSYQLWLLAALLASAVAVYALLRRGAGLSPVAAALGTWLAVFSSSRLHQMSHSQLLPMFWVALALLGALTWWSGGEVKSGPGRSVSRRRLALLGAAAALVAQLYGGFYLGFLTALALAALLAAALLARAGRQRLVTLLRADGLLLVAVGAVAALALVPWFRHYRAASELVGGRSWGEVESMVPLPQTWLYVSPRALAYRQVARWPLFARLPDTFEHAVSLGWLTTAAALAAALAGRRQRRVQVVALAVAGVVALTTSVGGHVLWRAVVELLPPLAAVRALSRVGLLLPLAAAVLLGSWLDACRGRRGRAAILALLALCGAEQLCDVESFDKGEQRRWVGEVVGRIDRGATAFYLTREAQRPGAQALHLDAMWAATATGVPTVNGYSGIVPPAWEPLRNARIRDEETARRLEAALATWLSAGAVDPARVQVIQLPAGYRRPEDAVGRRLRRAADGRYPRR